MAEKILKQVGLWEEVKDRFDTDSGVSLSGGQQQRLCIGRAISANPKILIMDEPCAALDPIATAKIEELMAKLSEQGYTIVIVTHNMQQAARISDRTALMVLGEIIEINTAAEMFLKPVHQKTKMFLMGQHPG